jgi:hypothetical protein
MLKNISRMQHVIGDRVYNLYCDHDSPTNEVKAALTAFFKFCEQLEEANKKAQEQKESLETDKELEELKVP